MSKSDIKGAVAQQFGNVAHNYTTSAVHAKGADLQTMVDCATLDSSMRVLDAGAGAGHTAMIFAPHVGEVVAYDLTEAMLEQVNINATERGLTNITTQQGDVESLPFDDNHFDLVVSRYSAHHWVNPQGAVHEFARVLKPDGVFILSDIVAPENPAYDTFLQTLELLRDPSHVRDFSVSQWERFFAHAGFTSETISLFDLTLNFEAWTTRMATPSAHVTALLSLFNGASADVKARFQLPDALTSETFDFVIPSVVIKGRL